MLTMLVSFVVTVIFLIKMIFSDMAGSQTTVDAVKEGVKNAKEINEVLNNTDIDDAPEKTGRFEKK